MFYLPNRTRASPRGTHFAVNWQQDALRCLLTTVILEEAQSPLGVSSAFRLLIVRSNNPAANTAKEDHQKKYPIARPISQPYQCALRIKATVEAHADKRFSVRVPRNITHGDPTTKSSDVSTLRIASREGPPPKLRKLSATAPSVMPKALKPLMLMTSRPITPPSTLVTAGRNQAEALRNQASVNRRSGLLVLAILRDAASACTSSICKWSRDR